ncbi:unnamed protein product [Schistosoma rodhaini]|uniref:Rhodopsin-like orphan GPCR,putative n=1 Tax=Schistosoma mansoni TaxID=6183 RepID=C4QJY1_SCHMA|nr:rhodopsin-like orphan GPCR,putative [Schistosoma mansoni]CAH8657788.1 unnamed protein product [Schistosoma rodhaini]|eukprot:XP_018644343.1 rhodopsin-like orphan GPCR,putative [Schistosoma mansoni]
MMENLTGQFRNTPWDTYEGCDSSFINTSNLIIQNDPLSCGVSMLLGAWSGYLLPVISILGLISNTFISAVTFIQIKLMPRHMIYMAFIAIMNSITNIIYGWLWLFSAKGLPFITKGEVYFIINNVSPMVCRIHRFIYSSVSTCMGNLLVCAGLDRFFCIYFPILFNKLPKYYVWFACGTVYLLSFLMMLPVLFISGWYVVESKIQCSLEPNQYAIRLYHALFSNLGCVQSLILVGVNLAFLLRIRKHVKDTATRKMSMTDRRQLHTTVFFLVYSASYTLTSIPQAVAYIIGRYSDIRNALNQSKFAIQIANIFWNLHFTRELFDFFIYFKYFKPFRLVVLDICRPCYKPKMNDTKQKV